MAMLKLMFHKGHVKGYWMTRDGQRIYARPHERTKPPSRYSSAFIERICRLYDHGHSAADIATVVHVSDYTVRHLLMAAGVAIRSNLIPQSVRDRAVELTRHGMPLVRIAEKLA